MNKYIVQLAELEWIKVLAIALLVGALYWEFGLDTGVTDQQFQAAETSRAQAKQSLEATQKALSDLKKFREELDSMNSQFQQVVELMPAVEDVADFMLLVREQATKAGAQVKKVEPGKEVEKVNFYETRKLEISLEGTYAQILTFLANLSRQKRLITVDSLSIQQVDVGSNNPEDRRVAFTGTLVSYRYVAPQPTPTPDAASPEAGEAPAPQPGAGQ